MSAKIHLWSVGVDRYVNGRPLYSIRRWNGEKYERYPQIKFEQFKFDRDELLKLVERLNYSAKAKAAERVAIRHAFIDPALRAEYFDYLVTQIPREKGARQEFSYLERYFLHYFIEQLNLHSPLQWYAVHDTTWARFLVSGKAPKSAKAKRDIVNAANRFMTWLHRKRPEEVPALEFEPISPAKFAAIEAERELKKQVRTTHLITPEHWTKIQDALPAYPKLEPFVLFGYAYGVRRSEMVGLLPGDVKKGHLAVERQLEKLDSLTILKGKMKRSIPHWHATAAQAYRWLETIHKSNLLVHPDTLTDYFSALMVDLKIKYTIHDLRHTFITRSLREHHPRDVQLAAGHKSISTTMEYAHDDRNLSDDVFVPGAG